MVEVLERIAEKSDSVVISQKENYVGSGKYSERSGPESTGYSIFAEMYLEKPADIGITASVSTWRGVPTIDDW